MLPATLFYVIVVSVLLLSWVVLCLPAATVVGRAIARGEQTARVLNTASGAVVNRPVR